MSIELDQFSLWSATFEVRFDAAFLMWDRSGAVWSRVKERYPTATVDQANPNQTRVIVDPRTQAVLSVDRAFFTISKPKNDLRELRAFAPVLMEPLTKKFEISGFTRVGLRAIFGKKFDTRREAADFVAAHAPIPKLAGKHLNVDGAILDPELYFVYEGEALGFSVRFKSQQTSMSLGLPPEFEDAVEASRVERNTVTLDVDYYAHGVTGVSTFDAVAVIESWQHLMRRDLRKVF